MITKTKPSALQTMRNQLTAVQTAQWRFCDEYGIVHVWARYEYQQLVVKAAEIKKSINYMEEIQEKAGV